MVKMAIFSFTYLLNDPLPYLRLLILHIDSGLLIHFVCGVSSCSVGPLFSTIQFWDILSSAIRNVFDHFPHPSAFTCIYHVGKLHK